MVGFLRIGSQPRWGWAPSVLHCQHGCSSAVTNQAANAFLLHPRAMDQAKCVERTFGRLMLQRCAKLLLLRIAKP
jgi:hypothetical protein